MSVRTLFRVMALASALAVSSASAAERLSVVANGETVGHVIATTKGAAIDIDYAVSNNGRGPKHSEHLVIAHNGLPAEWSIDGTSLMGGGVHEHLQWKDGVERWESQADKGEVKSAQPLLYIGNDASPWALGLYARVLLKSPNRTLDVLPMGTLSLEPVRKVTIGSGKTAVSVKAYFLTGINLDPEILLLDNDGRLFADLSDEIVVREGYEKEYATLMALGASLNMERLQTLQQRVVHRYGTPIRIRNVHIFDPIKGAMSDPISVVVYRGRIATVAPDDGAATPDETVIDGQGGFVIAGLHDMHSHNAVGTGPLNIAAGVTTVRDMGNINATLLDLVKRTDAGEVPGPHILYSGFLEGRSPYSARNGFIPETLEEGLRDVHWYADRGYIQIKIYNSMNPAWVKPLADEARRLGLRTVGHVPAFATPDQMIEAGYNEITHINQLMLGWLLSPGEDTRTPLRLTGMARAADLDLKSDKVRHTISLMKAHDVGLDTTTSIVEQLMMSRAGQVPDNSAAYLDHMPIGYLRYHKRSYVNFKDAAEEARYAAAFERVLQTMTLLHGEGVRLWPGTDNNIGFTLHRELELYVKAGMTPAEVLRIASYDCDAYMKRDQDYGSIERGKQADFFLVPDDPTKDINAVRHIRMVMKGGVIYYPEEIYRAYGIKPFAAPPPLTPASQKSAAVSAAPVHNAFAENGDD